MQRPLADAVAKMQEGDLSTFCGMSEPYVWSRLSEDGFFQHVMVLVVRSYGGMKSYWASMERCATTESN